LIRYLLGDRMDGNTACGVSRVLQCELRNWRAGGTVPQLAGGEVACDGTAAGGCVILGFFDQPGVIAKRDRQIGLAVVIADDGRRVGVPKPAVIGVVVVGIDPGTDTCFGKFADERLANRVGINGHLAAIGACFDRVRIPDVGSGFGGIVDVGKRKRPRAAFDSFERDPLLGTVLEVIVGDDELLNDDELKGDGPMLELLNGGNQPELEDDEDELDDDEPDDELGYEDDELGCQADELDANVLLDELLIGAPANIPNAVMKRV